MLTSNIVSRIQKNAKGYGIPEILDYIDTIQNIMLGKPLKSRRLFDTSTGRDPVLTTTAGTYEYELSSSQTYWSGDNAMFIQSVFSGWDSEDEYTNDGYGNLTHNDATVEYEVIEATQTECAKVCFHENPGTSTYYVTAYKKPIPITSKSIQLEIPIQHHRRVIEGVMALIELDENGGISQRYEQWEIKLGDFWNEMNRTKRGGKFGYRIPLVGY